MALPASVSAQGLSPQDEANARFQTGLKYYDNHDFESARLAFKQAYAVLQKPSILLNLALSELYSNRPLDAIVHFEEYIRDPSTPSDKRDKARKHLDEAMKKTAHLQIRTAPDAQVTVDGRPISPPYTAPVHVMPGAHAVEARLGAKTKSASVDPKAGDTVPIDLTFEGEPAPPTSDPPPTTNPSHLPPPDPATTYPPSTTTSDSFWGLRSIGGLALIAVGAGAIVGGLVFKSEASDEQSRIDELGAGLSADACSSNAADPRCVQLSEAVDARDGASTRGTLFLVAGSALAVVGAAGVVSSIVWPHRHATTTGLRPMLGPRQLGLSFSAHF